MRRAARLAVALVLLPRLAGALVLDFPAPATVVGRQDAALGSYQVPVGPWNGQRVATVEAEGQISQVAWRLNAATLTTLQILQPLRVQLAAAGYRVLYDCATEACGGFDFRYGISVLPEPDMHVDLGDFRFLSAVHDRAGGGADYVTLLVSHSSDAGFVQITQIGTDPVTAAPAPVPQAAAAPPPVPQDVVTRLAAGLPVALDDLRFDSGSADLAAGDYASLSAVAGWLKANPKATVALVGHTDDSGTLDANVALSKKRAASVADRLVKEYGVDRGQLDPEGVGYLAPRATNLTEAGREQNRRVEVFVTSTQ